MDHARNIYTTEIDKNQGAIYLLNSESWSLNSYQHITVSNPLPRMQNSSMDKSAGYGCLKDFVLNTKTTPY